MINRRDFFKISALFYFSTSLKNLFGNYQGERIIFSGESVGSHFKGNSSLLTISFNLRSLEIEKFPSPINAHSYVINPGQKNQVVGIEKWGEGMAIFDPVTFRLKKHITLAKPSQFVGHGVFSKDGSLFYVSVSDYQNSHVYTLGKGFIHVYETQKFTLVEKFETYGFEPHEISFFNEDKFLLVLNPGFGAHFQTPFIDNKGPIKDFFPSITIIDLKTKKLIKEILFKDKEITMAHLTKMEGNEFFLIGGKRQLEDTWENKAFMLNTNGELIPFKTPGTNLPGIPLLSSAYDAQTKTYAATSPTSNNLLLWKGGNLETLDLNRPQGVSLTKDRKFFVISQNDSISYINILMNKIVYQKKLINCQARGGHSLII